jgi:hypothetical protein
MGILRSLGWEMVLMSYNNLYCLIQICVAFFYFYYANCHHLLLENLFVCLFVLALLEFELRLSCLLDNLNP